MPSDETRRASLSLKRGGVAHMVGSTLVGPPMVERLVLANGAMVKTSTAMQAEEED